MYAEQRGNGSFGGEISTNNRIFSNRAGSILETEQSGLRDNGISDIYGYLILDRKYIDNGERIMFDKGLFGGMFDFNNDGKMDSFEKAAEFSFFMNMMSETEKSDSDSSDDSDESDD